MTFGLLIVFCFWFNSCSFKAFQWVEKVYMWKLDETSLLGLYLGLNNYTLFVPNTFLNSLEYKVSSP